MTDTVDTTVLPGLLTALRLPSIARHWQHYVTVADREGWPAARLLGTLLELEVADGQAAESGEGRDAYERVTGRSSPIWNRASGLGCGHGTPSMRPDGSPGECRSGG